MALPNLFQADPVLRRHLEARLDASSWKRAEPLLDQLGARAAGELDAWAATANASPPELCRYDASGERVDEVVFHPSYDRMRELAYGEAGLVWRAYADEDEGGLPRLATFAMSYLFAQAEQGLYCPVCLTDGTALMVQRHAPQTVREEVLPRLLARDTAGLWEGAMFLTEKQGGSDVGANRTRAEPGGEGRWRLHGDKWFCSNANAQAWMVLARPEGAPEGTGGLGLFYVPRHLEDGSRNAFRLERLKDKLGTRSMATGEIALDGAEAVLLGEPGEGFRQMTEMLTLSRVHNAVASAAVMRRALVESVLHARERTAFGRELREHPLHRAVLLDLTLEWEGSLALVLASVEAMETAWFARGASDGERERAGQLLRALTPIVKAYTAKAAVEVASEACEALGGNGYIEEQVTPRLLRDAQVLPIWEGTTSILSLDLLRALHRTEAVPALLDDLAQRVAAAPATGEALDVVARSIGALRSGSADLKGLPREEQEVRSRRLAFDLAAVAAAAHLAETAETDRGARVLAGWVEKHLTGGLDVRERIALQDYDLVVDGAVVTP